MARAPFVAVRTDIRKEERVLVIADIAGYNRHEAMGRLIDMWAWCADRKLQDAPIDCDGYAVNSAVVCRFLGPMGVRAILGDNCDDLALGSLRSDGLIYLRGTADTVSRLRAHHATAVAGGEARRSAGRKAKGVDGRFVAKRTNTPAALQQDSSSAPPVVQQSTSCSPAASSEIPDPRSQIQIPDPEDIARSPRAVVSPHQRVIAAFDQRFAARFGTKPTWGPKQGQLVKQLLKAHPPEELERRIEILFESPPEFLSRSAPDFGTFAQHVDKLVRPTTRAGPGRHQSAEVLNQLMTEIAIATEEQKKAERP